MEFGDPDSLSSVSHIRDVLYCLPRRMHLVNSLAYASGTNTRQSGPQQIVRQCSSLGPVHLVSLSPFEP